MNINNWESLIKELILISKKEAFEAKERKKNESNENNSGVVMAYYEIMSTFLSKCVAFQINPKEFHLENFIAEDLVNEGRTEANEKELELFKEIKTIAKDENTFKYYAQDLIDIIREDALEAKNQEQNTKTMDERDFCRAKLLIYKNFFENFHSLIKKFQLDPPTRPEGSKIRKF